MGERGGGWSRDGQHLTVIKGGGREGGTWTDRV